MLATLFRHGRAIRRLDSLNSSPSAVLNNIKLSRSCAGAEPALAAKGSQKQSKAKACMRIRSQCVTLATNEFALSTVTSAKSLQRGTIRPSPREERVTKAGAAPTTPPCCRSPLCTEFFHCEVATLRNALVQTTKPFSSVASRCANPRLPLARLTRRGKTAGSSVTQISHFHRPTVHFAPLSRSLSLSPALGVEAIFPRASQPASSLSAWNIVSHPARAHPSIPALALCFLDRLHLFHHLAPPLLPSRSVQQHPRAQPHCGAPVLHPSDSASAHALNHRRRLGRGEHRTSSFLLASCFKQVASCSSDSVSLSHRIRRPRRQCALGSSRRRRHRGLAPPALWLPPTPLGTTKPLQPARTT